MMFEERGSNEIRGTYIHPDLVNSLVSWLSTEYAFKVSRLMQHHAVHVANEQREADMRAHMSVIERLSHDYARALLAHVSSRSSSTIRWPSLTTRMLRSARLCRDWISRPMIVFPRPVWKLIRNRRST